jgi:steroid delta-isomerase-like uncharacterized protein
MKKMHISYMFLLIFFGCAKTNNHSNSIEKDKKLAIFYIMGVVNNRELELMNELFSPDYVYHESNGDRVSSIKNGSLRSFLEYLFQAIPDLKYEIISVVSERGIVAMNLKANGTHEGEFLGFNASGNYLQFREMFFFKIENDKIVEGWSSVNVEEVKNQLATKED